VKHRIAFVTYELVHGGSLTFLLNISREFQRRGIDHSIISLGPHHAMEKDFAAADVTTIRPDTAHRFIEDSIRFGLEQLRNFKPTHIIGCLGPQSLEILRYVPKEVSRLGLLQTDDPPVYAMLAAYAPYLDAVVGVSEYSCQALRSYPQLAHKAVYYQPYGIPTPEKLRTPSSRQDNPIRIAYVGRLVREQKRVHLLPQIVRALVNSGRPFVFRIAGSGAQLSWLKKNLQVNSSQQVIRFEGQVSYDCIPKLMLDSDIFLLPSDYEGLPLSLLEAMAHGAVPVVSDLPSGMREVVGPETGILVKPENIDGYPAAILKLDSDRESLANKSLAASRLIRNTFSCEAMADRWLNMFDALASAPAEWSPSPKVTYSVTVRKLGLPFLPPVRAINNFMNRFSGK
jgi:glycosyltransferase involved in cell wall biosynthesis